MNAIQQLEKWNAGHKGRSVKIEIDNSYGSTCWHVALRCGAKKVDAYECSFVECKPEQVPREVVFVCTPWEEMDEFPGLEKTIMAAIQRWEEL